MTPFNPFDKPLRDLAASDLAVLRRIAEGWYAEYKREVPNTSSIAKSVSAFANQFGGWLLYGVTEATDGSRMAGGFPGIPLADAAASELRVRDAVRTMMNPSAYFETRAVAGPCEEIALPEGRAILVVYVPEGADTPYLHGSGRVYRRVGDSSDPRELTDRGALDALFHRREAKRDRLRTLLETPLELSPTERDEPYLQLLLLSDPLGDRGVNPMIEFQGFADLMTNAPAFGLSTQWDNVFSSADGFIARHVGRNDPQRKLLTFEYRVGGSSVITLPLRRGLPRTGPGYLHQREFERACQPEQLDRALDVNYLLNAVGACVDTHRRLAHAYGISPECWAKARLENVWRCPTFLDTAEYVRFVGRYGVPVVQQHRIFAPPGVTYESLVHLFPDGEGAAPEDGPGVAPAAAITFQVLYALGIPPVAYGTPEEFLEAGVRSGPVLSGERG